MIQLTQFRVHFERFVAVLVEAENYGPSAGLDRDYDTCRTAVMTEYKRVAGFIEPYCRGELEGAPNELWRAMDLGRALNRIDIQALIWRTRSQIDLYERQLSYLISKQI